MKPLRVIPLLLLLGASMAATAQNADLKASYEKLRQCLMKKDIKGMFAMCAPDMTWTEDGRTMKQAEMKSQMEMQVKATQKYDEITFKLNKVTVKGNTAVVECGNVVRADVMMPGAKKVSKVVSKSNSVDTWVKGKGGWMIKSVVVKKSDTTIDGKPMKMGG